MLSLLRKPQIQSITVDDMRQFLQRWERPDSAVLGIVGDFQPAQVGTEWLAL